MFTNEQIQTISIIIELNDENRTRTPIAYRGSLFYVYSIDSKALCLVPINAIYIDISEDEEKFMFVPSQLVEVASNDVDINYIEDVIRYPQTQVSVKFAELQKEGYINRMQIVLKNVALLPQIDIEEQTVNFTGRFYKYDETDETYTLE